MRASGMSGTISPSTTGMKHMMPIPPVSTDWPQRCGSGSAWKASVTADWAATTASGSSAAKASAVAGTPRDAATSALTSGRPQREQTAAPLPLWTMARWNRPPAAGEAMSVATLIPPEDSPNTVT